MLDLNKVLLPKLEDGTYTVRIKHFQVQETMPDLNGEVKDRLEFSVAFPDRIQKIVVFPQQYDYIFGCLRRQLNLQDEAITIGELLKASLKQDIVLQVAWSNEYKSFNYTWTPELTSATDSQLDEVAKNLEF